MWKNFDGYSTFFIFLIASLLYASMLLFVEVQKWLERVIQRGEREGKRDPLLPLNSSIIKISEGSPAPFFFLADFSVVMLCCSVWAWQNDTSANTFLEIKKKSGGDNCVAGEILQPHVCCGWYPGHQRVLSFWHQGMTALANCVYFSICVAIEML